MLSQLTANQFRNLAPLAWRPAGGSHLLLGGNGAGKTSLLEAVYVLATTRSFRTSQVADCIRHGADLFHLEGEVEGERRVRLEVGYGKDWRLRTLNGKNASLPEHLGVLPVVSWTTADVEILTGAPRLRRRLMDRGVVGTRPAALDVLGRYRQALRHKRELLASGGPGLEAWNGVLAGAAAELIVRRAAYVEALREAFAGVAAEADLPVPPVELRYRPSPGGSAGEAGPPQPEAIYESLERIADRERQRQLPLLGPHRDDLEVRWGEHEIARVASAGERKALALLLIAAHGRVLKGAGADPVYLLDDADAELAIPTLTAVWKVFAGTIGASQILATSNRPQAWLTLPVDLLWRVEGGRIDPL